LHFVRLSLPRTALALVAAAVMAWASLSAPATLAQTLEPLVVISGDERHVFQVELATTPAERSRGLMYRRSMPADHGMLFDFEREEMVSMWMRNTYIPLDMLFIRTDGSVARIAQHTEPLSERTISSGEPVRFVLELNAGTSAQLGILPDDVVEHSLISGR
jgi:uncharacterized protein